MLYLKQTMAMIMAMSSAVVFAGSMGGVCTPGDITVPCETAGWDVAADALYLIPTFGGNGLGYTAFGNYSGGDVNNVFHTVNGAPNKMYNVTPKWGWGFQIAGDYHFSSGQDIGLNWYHLYENVTGYLPVGSEFSGGADGFYAGRLDVAPKWDAINLEFGKRFNLSDEKMLRLHAGLEFARIKTTFTNYLQFQPIGSLAPVPTIDTMTYYGLGPRVGADFNYQIGHGVGVYVKAAGGVLVGSSKQNISGYQDVTVGGQGGYGTAFYSTANIVQSHHSVLVPELEAKLGANYDYQFASGLLTVDIGYLWMNYLQAIQSYTGIGIAGGPSSGVGASVGNPTTTNFTLNGLYFGMKWLGNW